MATATPAMQQRRLLAFTFRHSSHMSGVLIVSTPLYQASYAN
jgi:hypothetical protein